MDDATRRHWEQIADDTIDRAIADAIAELEALGGEFLHVCENSPHQAFEVGKAAGSI